MNQADERYLMPKDLSGDKCIVVIDESLPLGLQVNAASVITMTLGDRVDGLVGPDVKDADGVLHPGVIIIPVPILCAGSARVVSVWKAAGERDAVVRVGFTSLAQSCRNYTEYTERMSATSTGQLSFAGVGLFGPKRDINRLAGSLPLLR